jgi:N-acetylglucosamine transport system permease protein
MTRHQERTVFIILFLLPGLLTYTIFVILPGLQAFWISLYEWDGMGPSTYIGFGNFLKMFRDDLAQKAIINNVYLLVVPTLVVLVLALLFGELIRSGVKGGGFFQIVFFFPNLLSMVIVGIIWLFVFSPNLGLLNAILRGVGLVKLAKPWLGIPGLVVPAIGSVMVWMAAGYYMVLLLAAMKNIPLELYESAMLDGANRFQQFWFITVPMVWEVLRVLVTLLFLGAIQQFALVWVMTEGGPNGASEVLGTFMYKNAFRYFNIGYGNAVAVVMFILVFVFSIVSFRWMSRRSFEY